MASIRKRGDRYAVQVRKGGHKPLFKTFRTKREAMVWARRTEADIDEGAQILPLRHTLSDAIDRFRADPDRAITRYQETVFNWWKAQLGARRLTTLQRRDFIAARDILRGVKSRQGDYLARATINRRLSLISAVLTEAVGWDWLTTNPARIRRLSENNARERLLTPEEQERLLLACLASDEPALYPFVVCAMLSGARAGELQGLTWRYVDLELGVARLIRTKNGKRRPVPLPPTAQNLLRDLHDNREGDVNPGDYVFRNHTGHAPFYYRKAWGEARASANLADFRFHDLRHLTASTLAMAGASQRELQEVLGHNSPAMTQRYSHFFDTHVAKLGKQLDRALFDS